MKQLKNLEKLNNLSYFDLNTLSQVVETTPKSLYKNTNRWNNNDTIIKLKNGMYTTSDYYNNLSDKNAYIEFISNKMRYPSYLSLEYVLSKQQILTESVFSYTCVTLKTTRLYTNKFGNFSYRKIAPQLFIGFEIIKISGFEIAIASKSKALFDYFYLKFYREPIIDSKKIVELRLNLEEFTKTDIKEFQKYCTLTKISKFKNLPEQLFNYAN